MRDRAKLAAVILAFLGIFGFVIFQVGVASQPQKQHQGQPQRGEHANSNSEKTHGGNATTAIEIECDPNCAKKYSNEEGNESYLSRMIRKTLDDPLTILTGVLAIATFGLVIGVLIQVRDARIASERQLRAYISAKPSNLRGFIVGQIPTAQFIVLNHGQTPAYKIRHIAIVDVVEHPILPTQPNPLVIDENEPIPTLVLHPRSDMESGANGIRKITAEDIERVLKGTDYALYLFGLVIYEDAFGEERRTNICAYVCGPELAQIIDTAQKPGVKAVAMPWNLSPYLNEAD